MRPIRLLAGFLAGLLVASAGCGGGDPVGDVSGTVSVDGAPAPDGATVTFNPTGTGQTPVVATVAAGRYSARVPVGAAKVAVSVVKKTGEKKQYPTADSPVMPIMTETLPEKYHAKTELKYDVKPGKQEHNLDLKTK